MLTACIKYYVTFEPSHHPTPNGRYGDFIYRIEAVWVWIPKE